VGSICEKGRQTVTLFAQLLPLSFCTQTLVEFPDLNKYQDHWPIQLYFNRWIIDRVHHCNFKAKVFFGAQIQYLNNTDT
jgi:hypothetical protein